MGWLYQAVRMPKKVQDRLKCVDCGAKSHRTYWEYEKEMRGLDRWVKLYTRCKACYRRSGHEVEVENPELPSV